MNQEIVNKIQQLKVCLYQNSSERSELDKVSIQKSLFELLRECIKEREYHVVVGSYVLDIHPSSLSVKYETDETTVEISNEDIYFETTRELEVRYFALEDKDVYSEDTPVIEVTGMVTNVEGVALESYQIELFTNDEADTVKRYLNILEESGFNYTDVELEDAYSVIVTRSVRKEAPRFDVSNFFKTAMVVPIRYNYVERVYEKEVPARREFVPNDYRNYLPSLDDKKDLVTFIYTSMIEFYTNYINNQ